MARRDRKAVKTSAQADYPRHGWFWSALVGLPLGLAGVAHGDATLPTTATTGTTTSKTTRPPPAPPPAPQHPLRLGGDMPAPEPPRAPTPPPPAPSGPKKPCPVKLGGKPPMPHT